MKVAKIIDGKEASIWVYDLSGTSSMRKLTLTGANRFPIWSADGEHIAFQSDREGDKGIFWQRADGTGTAERLTMPEKDVEHIPDSWSPDGRKFSFSAVKGNTEAVWIFSFPDKKATVFAEAPGAFITNSVFSPDGKWLAYQSYESQRSEIFVQPFPPTGAKYQVSTEGGTTPLWSPARSQLYYWATLSQHLVAVDVQTEPTFSVGKKVVLAIDAIPVAAPFGETNYDLTPDGKQFVVVTRAVSPSGDADRSPAQQMEFVLNWFDELRRLAPITK